MLNINIFSREWFVEGNEFTMEPILDQIQMLNDMLQYKEDDDSEKMLILESIYSQDLSLLDEDELEVFIALCINTSILILEEVKEEFEEEDYYNKRFKQLEMVLNKAYEVATKIHEISNNLKWYYHVIFFMGEACMEAHDFDMALKKYEKIDKDFPNYDQPVRLKIFSIKYYTQNGAQEYLDLQKNEKGAGWDYNRALYYYSINNEPLALKYLKDAVRKNKYIKDLLLNEYEPNADRELSTIEIEAVEYWAASEWIWQVTDEALEWMFYNI